MPATPLVIVEEVDPLDLRIQIPSTDLSKAKIGDTIHVRFPATGQSLDARLTRVVAAMDPHTRTFSAIAELANHDHTLRSGLYAEVTLGEGKAADSVSPTKAKIAAKKSPAVKVSKD
jgi:Cu(I)/Ag(I) efflux system membrane fusion protein